MAMPFIGSLILNLVYFLGDESSPGTGGIGEIHVLLR